MSTSTPPLANRPVITRSFEEHSERPKDPRKRPLAKDISVTGAVQHLSKKNLSVIQPTPPPPIQFVVPTPLPQAQAFDTPASTDDVKRKLSLRNQICSIEKTLETIKNPAIVAVSISELNKFRAEYYYLTREEERGKVLRLTNELQTARDQMDQMTRLRAESTKFLEEERARISHEFAEERNILEGDLKKRVQLNAELEKSVEALQGRIRQLEQKNQQQHSKLSTFKTSNAALSTKNLELSAEVASFQKERNALNQRIDQLTQENTEVRTKVVSLEEARAAQDAKIGELIKEQDSLRSKVEREKARTQRERDRGDEYKGKVSAINALINPRRVKGGAQES